MPETIQHRETLTGSGTVNASGSFEILAITAGTGNGWEFSAEVLQASVALWDQAECFIDHSWFGHSIRDLAGHCHSPEWDEEHKGIKLQLKPVGPSGPLLAELGKQVLEEETAANPNVGFSADVVFTSSGKNVTNILKVLSIDLVMDPARGGAFLRALNSTYPQGGTMPPTSQPPVTVEEPAAPPAAVQAAPVPAPQAAALQQQLTEDQAAVRELLNETARQQAIEQEAAEARQVRLSMCGYLLDSALASSHLPAPVAERVRAQFKDRIFTAPELQAAIEDSRQMLSELTAGQSVHGPNISAMFTSEDQISAAIHDLLGAERPEGLQQVNPARLSGIRELYLGMTGDYDFIGGYNPSRVQFATTTASLPGVLKNALNKLIIQKWQELGRAGYRWWEPVVSVEHFNSLQSLTGVLVGEVTLLPSVAEGGPYTELDVSDSPETASWTKYGGYIGLTLEMFERDETHKLRQYPQKLASSGLRRISNLVAAIFTANSGAGPVMSDTKNVFHADHSNLGTAALGSSSWEAASTAIYGQSMVVASGGTAPKLALDAKYLLVPRALRLTGMQLLYPNLEHTANIHSENMQRGEYGDVITVPDWTDVTDWAAVADPRLAPAIVLAERFGLMPEIFLADNQLNGALFTNDQIRIKARHFVSIFVADYRPLYKANVADS